MPTAQALQPAVMQLLPVLVITPIATGFNLAIQGPESQAPVHTPEDQGSENAKVYRFMKGWRGVQFLNQHAKNPNVTIILTFSPEGGNTKRALQWCQQLQSIFQEFGMTMEGRPHLNGRNSPLIKIAATVQRPPDVHNFLRFENKVSQKLRKQLRLNKLVWLKALSVKASNGNIIAELPLES